MAARRNARRSTKPAEQQYYAQEIAEHCDKIFEGEVSSECVEAALRSGGVEKTSITNAKKIVKSFLKKEVV